MTFHPKFTDDTVMTLAIARWLMSGNDKNASRLISIMQSMGREYIDRGFSPKFKRWIQSDNPRPSNSYGNFSSYNYQITVDSSWADVAHLNVMAKINGITVATATVRANRPS